MKVHFDIQPMQRRLRQPIVTSHGRVERRDGWLVSATLPGGSVGWGEAAPLPMWGTEGPAETLDDLTRAARTLAGEDPCSALERIEASSCGPIARAGLEQALLDACARSRGLSLAQLISSRPPRTIAVNALLREQTPDALEREAAANVAAGFRSLKMKVASGDLTDDLERVAAARRGAGSGVSLRLDANCGWSFGRATDALERLAVFDIELIEEPLARPSLPAWQALRKISPVPLAADESATPAGAATSLIESGAIDAIVLKPAALGGVLSTRALAVHAARQGVAVVITSLLEGAIGIAGAWQVAASLDVPPLACGLATGDWLEDDCAPAPAIIDGELRAPDREGIGLSPC